MKKTSTFDPEIVLETAHLAADAGAKVLMDYFGKLHHVSEKHLAGLVSEADVESEKVIQQILQKAVPAQFLGEESFKIGPGGWPTSGDWWIVDPLDGTTNYVHRFPIFCISIGLMWQGELVFGMVDVPMLKHRYWATRGRGAFRNGSPIKVSEKTSVRDSLLATGFFRDQPIALKQQLEIFSKLVYEARGIRRAGAAAYDLCLVAEGVFEGFWEKNLNPWDTAAGVVLVREAGGQVTTYEGREYNIALDSLIATNGQLHQTLLKSIQPHS